MKEKKQPMRKNEDIKTRLIWSRFTYFGNCITTITKIFSNATSQPAYTVNKILQKKNCYKTGGG
jgi:hypothetical protein